MTTFRSKKVIGHPDQLARRNMSPNSHSKYKKKKIRYWSPPSSVIKLRILFLTVSLICGCLLLLFLNKSSEIVSYAPKAYLPSWLPGSRNSNIVYSKNELANVDINSRVRNTNTERSSISLPNLRQPYKSLTISGFASQLNLAKSSIFKKIGLKINDPSDPANLERIRFSSENLLTCDDLAYSNQILYSTERIIIKDNIKMIKDEILKPSDWLSDKFTSPEDSTLTEEDLLSQKWGRFGTSSVWVESLQYYITVSRITYSADGKKSEPDVSLVRGQLFDRNWNEVKGKYIPKLHTYSNDRERHNNPRHKACEEVINDPLSYYNCLNAKSSNSKPQDEKEWNKFLIKNYIVYPKTFHFEFNAVGKGKGMEDPRIILRKTAGFEEPMVVFNLDNGHGRKMFSLFPHRSERDLLQFNYHEDGNTVQKNWTPFFSKEDLTGLTDFYSGYVHFIKRMHPLEILRCSLVDGSCKMVYKSRISSEKNIDIIRGGTQYVPLPTILPEVYGKQIWIGFPKLHINKCGCGERFYRPMLSILVEENGVFNQEMLVPSLDFETDVLSWDEKNSACGGFNVMSPNSISAWEVLAQDPKTKRFDDYLTLTYGESDSRSSVITVRGILDYVLNIYKQKNLQDTYKDTLLDDFIIKTSFKCVADSAARTCKEYGLTHPEKTTDTDTTMNVAKQSNSL
ncbi:hypothetical protein TBLA_0B04780 [Henningerozyma blattae CBS 6284]|uniref:Beta-mannosyltransferase 1 n=1 Tax=Henningerozyma blattae (strain ATCC 34711 / CBS 6284 / DSM 70876 / NBRC 10599 / NRRL Y-10934 / UCD 77-7) TaxID=1071380 RepID=I2GYW1_HENB6|nr:hypothetical protein TBLA_0B04780 [Tetrapisispora blattae CBS 6284]CCH59313.1 hypothetical protein TBLA_0B04780 [Tetrapisispora blattae CBS 6284]